MDNFKIKKKDRFLCPFSMTNSNVYHSNNTDNQYIIPPIAPQIIKNTNGYNIMSK